MSNLAIEAAFGPTGSAGQRHIFKRVMSRSDIQVGDAAAVDRLSLSSGGYLYPRKGTTDRQQASESTEQRSLRVEVDELVVNPMWLTGGSVAVSGVAGAVSPDYRVFTPSARVEPRFLHHLLRSQPYRDQYDLFVRANTTFDRRIQQQDLDQMPLWLPPRDEQRRIADFLDDRVARIDQIIAARKSQIECNQEQFSSAMDERLEQVPDRVRASRVLRVLPGLAFPSEEFSHDPADIPLLRGINVGVGALRWDDTVYWPPQRLDEVRAFVLSEGDVVMGMDRPWVGAGLRIARVTAGDGSPLLLQRVAKLSPSHALVASYTYWAYQSSRFREQVESALTGLSVPHLSGEQILGYQLPICSLEKQREISDCLEVLSAAMLHADAALTSSIDLLIEYRQSLITAAVTGELDVTTAGSGIPR